jgi:glycosyltransferase involved in cell wall biosynthesis
VQDRRPRVAFAMPVLNGAAHIERALTSIQGQTLPNLEIVIADNDSVDSTLDVARAFSALDSRVRWVTGTRVDVAGSFRRALHATEAEYVCWAAFDDVWYPEFASDACKSLDQGRDYFVANWWVGNIATRSGGSLPTHPLREVLVGRPLERLFKFVNLHHMTHKCNLVYGVYRRDFLERCLEDQDVSDDGTFSANVVYRGEGEFGDRVLFAKDFHGNPRRYKTKYFMDRATRGALSARLSPGFDAARRKALTNLTRLWPMWSDEFAEIFRHYRDLSLDPHIMNPSDLQELILRAGRGQP